MSKSGKTTRRPGRPRTSLIDKISNLHLLLRAPYFSKWPLEIRFFSEDVYRAWGRWCERIDTHVRPGIKVYLDPAPVLPEEEEFTSGQPATKRRKADLIGKGGVEGVDPTYARLQGVLEKSQFLLDEGDDQICSICTKKLNLQEDLFVVCPTDPCNDLSHVACLADASLGHHNPDVVVPENGHCPSCRTEHSWVELMQQVTLRLRGAKVVQKLLGKKGKSRAATAAEILETESEEDLESEDEDLVAREVANEEADLSLDEDDNASIASVDTAFSKASAVDFEPRIVEGGAPLQIVIEDSEDEI